VGALNINTSDYKMEIKIKDNYSKDIHISQYIEICDKDNYLYLNIPTRTFIINATLVDNNVLYNCVIDDYQIVKAKELLNLALEYIRKFPHIKTLELHDTSYHPYNGSINENLDLLSYSVAIYGKTWYEIHCKALSDDYERYRKEVHTYMCAKMTDWFLFFHTNIITGYSSEIILKDESTYQTMYNSSNTYPEFFQKLTNHIRDPIFFRWWVNNFISSFINIPRYWYISV
jgi:hypothetical protein